MVGWVQDRLDVPGSFRHSYRRWKPSGLWSCDSLYGAFESYHWAFEFAHPDDGRFVRGTSFAETRSALEDLGRMLSDSLAGRDVPRCLAACLSVLAWGGVVRGNERHLRAMGSRLLPHLEGVKSKLVLESLDTRALPRVQMSSGMVKIYSLLVDDLVMYDSRVAAALCLLTRLFCQDADIRLIPVALRFRLLPHRSRAQRDPGTREYTFPLVAASGWTAYLDSVARASWLLRAVVRGKSSRFSPLAGGTDLHALQSALFMVGYDVSAPAADGAHRGSAGISPPAPIP